jgi:hypothetical protein
MRSHLNQVYKQTGIKPKELEDENDFPLELHYLWSWYAELKSFKIPLTYSEIKSWSDLSGITLITWELETLVQLEIINAGE